MEKQVWVLKIGDIAAMPCAGKRLLMGVIKRQFVWILWRSMQQQNSLLVFSISAVVVSFSVEFT